MIHDTRKADNANSFDFLAVVISSLFEQQEVMQKERSYEQGLLFFGSVARKHRDKIGNAR